MLFDRGKMGYPISGYTVLDNVSSGPSHQLPSQCQVPHDIPISDNFHLMVELIYQGRLLQI